MAPDGTTVKRYAPKTEPEALAGDIEALLADSGEGSGPPLRLAPR